MKPQAVGRTPGWALFEGLFLAVSVLLSGCHKRIEVVFERPPAASQVPLTPESPTDEGEDVVEASEMPETPAEEPNPPAEEEPVPRPVPSTKPPAPVPPEAPPEPSLPRLEDPKAAEAGAIREKLALAEGILASLDETSLTKEQLDVAATARTFVLQARQALEEGDYRRASVLADKGLILAQDVKKSG